MDIRLVYLFLLFFFLKLGGLISWSWWWVTAPLWIPFVIPTILGLGCIGIFIFVIIVVLIEGDY